jgi:hypothetical protein
VSDVSSGRGRDVRNRLGMASISYVSEMFYRHQLTPPEKLEAFLSQFLGQLLAVFCVLFTVRSLLLLSILRRHITVFGSPLGSLLHIHIDGRSLFQKLHRGERRLMSDPLQNVFRVYDCGFDFTSGISEIHRSARMFTSNFQSRNERLL